jgi:hypothetical protein
MPKRPGSEAGEPKSGAMRESPAELLGTQERTGYLPKLIEQRGV